MPQPEWLPPMSRRRRRLIAVLATTATVAALLPTGVSTAAPTGNAASAARSSGPFADGHGSRDVDNRAGTAAPNARQRGAGRAPRPASLEHARHPARARPGGRTPLATGLSADPETAARAVPRAQPRTCSGSTRRRWPRWTLLVRPIGAGTGRAAAPALRRPAGRPRRPGRRARRQGHGRPGDLVAVARHPRARSRPRSRARAGVRRRPARRRAHRRPGRPAARPAGGGARRRPTARGPRTRSP